LPNQLDRLVPEAGHAYARLSTIAFSKPDRDRVLSDTRRPPEKSCEGNVRQEEIFTDLRDRIRQNPCTHQAVGAIGVDAPRAGCEKEHPLQDPARQDPPPSVIATLAIPVDDVELVPHSPKPEEVLRVALPVGVQLRHERDSALNGDSVTTEAGLAMAPIGLIEDFQAWSQLFGQAREHLSGFVLRTVVNHQKGEVFRPVSDFQKPFADDFP